jgi:hypothetical protein
VVKRAFLALLPVAIMPFTLGVLIVYRFGLTIDAILIMIMLAQFYIIWIQVDVSLRQNRLGEVEYEPSLILILAEGNQPRTRSMRLKNSGNYPAYNVMAHSSDREFLVVGTLEPKEEKGIWSVSEDRLTKEPNYEISVSYSDVLDRDGSVSFSFSPKFISYPITVPNRIRMPGLLLNAIEDLQLTYSALTLNRRIKRMKQT